MDHRLLDSARSGHWRGTQVRDGCGMDNGRDRLSGLLVGGTSFLFGLVDGSRGGIRNRQLGHLGVLPNARWAASGRKVVRPAKWLRKSRGSYSASTNRVHSGLDRSFPSRDQNYRGCLSGWRLGLGVLCRRNQASDLARGSREQFSAHGELKSF